MIRSSRPIPREMVADHYQDLDRIYREVWGEHVHHGLWRTGRESPTQAVEQLVEMVASELGVTSGHALVDIGSGYGATARYLASKFAARVTALTITPAQYEFALATDPRNDNPRYLLRDWLENDLPGASFDGAYAIESTEHMEDKALAFAEARRVLKPGGRFVICAWIAAERAKPWEKRHLLEPICREGRLPGMGTETDYRELLDGAGFTVEAVTEVSREVRKTWGICLRRAVGKVITDPASRAYLLSSASRNRDFMLSVARIWAAYRTGAMRYLVFRSRRPLAR